MRDVFIIGAKSIGTYGGFETFLYKLLETHQNNERIQYHVACKANGEGYMDESIYSDSIVLGNNEFELMGAHCFKIPVPDIGAAVAIYYDLKALSYCINYIKSKNIKNPIIYILASRIGPFLKHYTRIIHKLNGKVYINPDGHEWLRSKWSRPVKLYWKISECLMVKNADYVICDSKHIEWYIHDKYDKKNFVPHTRFIAYGADIDRSKLKNDSPEYIEWLDKNELKGKEYYLIVGRFVPENNYSVIIREFMNSASDKSLVIITTENEKLYEEIEKQYRISTDERIVFCKPTYDKELLKKIRENAHGYIHGHEVGGTNPSLLESLAATKLNLLLDVAFNREVAGEGAYYWNKENGALSKLIDYCDKMTDDEILALQNKAQKGIREYYNWGNIVEEYEKIFLV